MEVGKIGIVLSQAKECLGTKKLEEAKDSSQSLEVLCGLSADTLVWTSSLRTCERIYFWCCKPPGWGCLFWQPQETKSKMKPENQYSSVTAMAKNWT